MVDDPRSGSRQRRRFRAYCTVLLVVPLLLTVLQYAACVISSRPEGDEWCALAVLIFPVYVTGLLVLCALVEVGIRLSSPQEGRAGRTWWTADVRLALYVLLLVSGPVVAFLAVYSGWLFCTPVGQGECRDVVWNAIFAACGTAVGVLALCGLAEVGYRLARRRR